MVDRTVTSPVGDTILLLTDEELAELAGIDLGNRHSFAQAMRQNPDRMALLGALWRHGPVVDRQSGRATGKLVELAGGGIKNPTAALTAAPVNPIVERETNGKRTYEIRLVALPERWLPAIESAHPAAAMRAELPEREVASTGSDERMEGEPTDDEPHPSGSPSPLSATVTHLPQREMTTEVADAVATALLAQVAAIISRGTDQAPVANRLRDDLTTLSERLGTQVEYVDKLRRDLRVSTDQIAALKVERDGLRQRLRDTEHNLKVATSADAARIIDAEVHRQVDKMMRQAPGGQHHPVESAR